MGRGHLHEHHTKPSHQQHDSRRLGDVGRGDAEGAGGGTDERGTKMTITYDATTQRATHVESGLAIEFLRYGPYTRESDVYFKLTWRGVSREFEASFDSGYKKISRDFPDLDPVEKGVRAIQLNEVDFETSNIGIDIKTTLKSEPGFCDHFVRVWHKVVAERNPTAKISVHFRPFFNPADGEWSFGR
jgi:hypothetical protein